MKYQDQFDAIIIGFGKGGKTLAAALGNAGKRTALIERYTDMYGGTCINAGCIPTKFLMYKARKAKELKNFSQKQKYYKQSIEQEIALTERLRAKNLAKVEGTPNVTVITGCAKLCSPNKVEVDTDNGKIMLKGAQIFLNTGSTPVIPPIDGIFTTNLAITSETLLRRKSLPEKLIILGGGYIGIEFASIYSSFGSKVTVIESGNLFLPKEDREIATDVYKNMTQNGIEILIGEKIKSIKEENEKVIATLENTNGVYSVEADILLIATGRKPNTERLCPENAGLSITPRGGIRTDEHLCTDAPNIYAMGDVVGGLQFTYISLDDFRVVRSAVLEDGSYTINDKGTIPYSVFTDPPFSRVGMTEKEAIEKGYSLKIARLSTAVIPKAIITEETTGILKAVIDEKTGLILGAHLFCDESHEMINIIKLAIDKKLPYTILRDMIFTHPTMSEALNDLFNV